MGSKVEDVIEYVQIKYDLTELRSLFDQTIASQPREYLECGAQSWTLGMGKHYQDLWKPLLQQHAKVHSHFCPLATGFNYSKTNSHNVPPHVDIDQMSYYNLLIPVAGVARIDIFKTQQDELEFRHGLTHWMMLREGVASQKIGEFFLDKPTLLNTNHLHSVHPIYAPRSVWCTRWIGLPVDLSFREFKKKVEDTLNA